MAQVNKPKRPICWRTKTNDDGSPRRCLHTGYPVTLHGEFSDGSMLLCHECVREVMAKGWKVRYTRAEDRPAQIEA